MEGGMVIVVEVFLFVLIIFMFKISNAETTIEFYVVNHFIHEEGIKLEFEIEREGQRDSPAGTRKLLQGEILHWSKTVDDPKQYDLTPKVSCKVYICAGDKEVEFGSFKSFDVQRYGPTDSGDRRKNVLKWSVYEGGSSLLQDSRYQPMHKWICVALIFHMTNKFSNEQDIIFSLHSTKPSVAVDENQKRVPRRENVIVAHKIGDHERHLTFNCFIDKVLEVSRQYVGFFQFSYSRVFHSDGSLSRIRNFEITMNEDGATVSSSSG